ncbi:MAG: hypothetical protein ACK4MD_05220 [Demequina sp.]
MRITDVAARYNLAYPTAHREVGRLLEAGILRERHIGRTRIVRANLDSSIPAPLRDLLLVSTDPVVLLARELAPITGIACAFPYGSFAARVRGVAGPPPQDIDAMVAGTPDGDAVYSACSRVEERVRDFTRTWRRTQWSQY